ncbi:hypothetical protein BDR03DRAFT_1010941 [Suillus americanus]|nr:hypothetical protein BDR03DRAFT_1010941 [Suillus americanus]
MSRETRVEPPMSNPAADHTCSGLTESIHAPNNTQGDQNMEIPTNPTTLHTPTAEEEAILAHLAMAETNRSIMSQNGPHHRTILPQFTPIPIGGFPKVHMLHSAQIFDHLDTKVLLAWFQVVHPKFLVRVFDHSGKDITEGTAIIAERIHSSVAIIANYIHQDAAPIRVSPPQPQGGRSAKDYPTCFLVHNISDKTKELILNQCIWSATNITFEALPFACQHPPDLLFCLSSFTTSNVETVHKMVADVWAHEDNRHHINNFFSTSEIVEEELVYKATRDLIRSIRIEHLDFKVTGGLSIPHFNIFATSPTTDAKTWTDLRGFLHILDYPTGLNGCGTAVALHPCPICHSLAHPHGLCPFPEVPLWNGPRVSNRTMTNGPCTYGRPRGGRTGQCYELG